MRDRRRLSFFATALFLVAFRRMLSRAARHLSFRQHRFRSRPVIQVAKVKSSRSKMCCVTAPVGSSSGSGARGTGLPTQRGHSLWSLAPEAGLPMNDVGDRRIGILVSFVEWLIRRVAGAVRLNAPGHPHHGVRRFDHVTVAAGAHSSEDR